MMKILVLSRITIGARLSSPGIRAYHMADVLARRLPEAEVTLAVPGGMSESVGTDLSFRVVPYTLYTSLRVMARHDIIICPGFPLQAIAVFPRKKLVLDFFTQYFMEWLENSKDDPGMTAGRRSGWIAMARRYLNMQLTFADFVICANERQRDTYVGSLMTLGLIDPSTYDRDNSLRQLIDVASLGVRTDELKQTEKVLKGVYTGIRPTDRVLLWHGGILHWYDPATLLRAMHQIRQVRDDVKLVFVGSLYPGLPALGLGKRFAETVELARELGLYNTSVFFDVGWVPYEQIKNYLLEADLGVCTYFENMETRYSHRTRFLDLFWAERPIVCTGGDVLAALVEERGLGLVVGEGDVAGLAESILRLLDDAELYESCRENIRRLKGHLAWDVTLEPLLRFCRDETVIARRKTQRLLPLLLRTAQYVASRLLLTLSR
jgi:glycosyltransferase involved in cell wall biosynthesis